MKTQKLFNILVIGGNILAAHGLCAEGDDKNLSLAFCNPNDEAVCVVGEDGTKEPKKGLICCWSSSCDE